MGLEDHVERVRGALAKRMGGKSYLRPQGLIDAIAQDLRESPLTVRQCIGRLAKESWLEGVSHEGVPFGQVKIIGQVQAAPDNPERQKWLAAIARKGVNAKDGDALAPLSTKLAPFSDEEMGYIIDGLVQLRANLSEEAGRHRFLVSAKYLMGSSKLLDELPSSALRSFGISVELFPRHPLYVVVAGPPSPKAVVLVENPAAFELAAKTLAIEDCTFIATFGFGLSKASEEFGTQLAGMVEEGFSNAVTLAREGASPLSAKELLAHRNITFWGDLDIAGMQIYERIARHLPTITLSALYDPMIEAITMGDNRHPYVSAVGKQGQTMFQATREDVQTMLSYCHEWAVDQELVTASQIEEFAGKPFVFR